MKDVDLLPEVLSSGRAHGEKEGQEKVENKRGSLVYGVARAEMAGWRCGNCHIRCATCRGESAGGNVRDCVCDAVHWCTGEGGGGAEGREVLG